MDRVRKILKAINLIGIIVLALIFFQCAGSSSNSEKESNVKMNNYIVEGKYPEFEFTKEIHKFGKISEGEIGVCDFYFKNIGERDLVIKNIESSCGCANFKWKKKPIKSGEESKITIEFNSKGRYGRQYKVITIFCNTLKGTKKLAITANVE